MSAGALPPEFLHGSRRTFLSWGCFSALRLHLSGPVRACVLSVVEIGCMCLHIVGPAALFGCERGGLVV